jgi:putative transcriptional regulator
MNIRPAFASILATAACTLFLAAAPAHSQADKGAAEGKSPGPGMMLVAKPELEAPYGETVLIVMPLGDQRHVGFILNRPLEEKMANLFPDNQPAQKVLDPVRFGGPVMSDTIFALAQAPDDPTGSSLPIFGDVKVVTHADVINRILATTPNDARYFVGFVGWQPGELEAEVAKGFWFVMDPRPELVFNRETAGMWRELVDHHRAR